MSKLLKNVFLSVGILATALFAFSSHKVEAAAIASNGTGGGAWGDTATWSGGAVPTSADTVTLAATDTVTLATGTAEATSLTVATGTTFTVTGGTVTIPTVTVTGTGAFNNGGTATIATALGGTGTFVNTGTLNLGGTTTVTTLTATAAGNTVNYNAATNQTVKAVNYYNLTLSGGSSAVKTIGSAIVVANNLSIAASTSVDLTGATTTKYLKFNGATQHRGIWGFTGATNVVHVNTVYMTAGTGTITASHDNIPASNGPTQVITTFATTPTCTSTQTLVNNVCTENVVTPSTTPATPETPTTPTTPETLCPNGKTLASNCKTAPTGTVTPPATPNGYAFGLTLVKKGTTGEACKAWQNFFNDKTGANLVVDGNCGKLTIAAAKAWQKSVGLKADGILGAKSRAKATE